MVSRESDKNCGPRKRRGNTGALVPFLGKDVKN